MIGERLDVLPDVLYYHIDQPLMICVTLPMWIFIYLLILLRLINFGQLTVSRLLGGIPKNLFMTLFLTASSFYSIFTQVPTTFNSTVALQVGFLKHLGDVATVLLDLRGSHTALFVPLTSIHMHAVESDRKKQARAKSFAFCCIPKFKLGELWPANSHHVIPCDQRQIDTSCGDEARQNGQGHLAILAGVLPQVPQISSHEACTYCCRHPAL